jgi:hypothetical protein
MASSVFGERSEAGLHGRHDLALDRRSPGLPPIWSHTA